MPCCAETASETNVHEKTARLPVDAWASKSTYWINAGGFVSTSSCEGLLVPLLLLPRKTDGQIGRQSDRETDRRTDMLADVQTDQVKDKWADTQMETQTDTQIDTLGSLL